MFDMNSSLNHRCCLSPPFLLPKLLCPLQVFLSCVSNAFDRSQYFIPFVLRLFPLARYLVAIFCWLIDFQWVWKCTLKHPKSHKNSQWKHHAKLWEVTLKSCVIVQVMKLIYSLPFLLYRYHIMVQWSNFSRKGDTYQFSKASNGVISIDLGMFRCIFRYTGNLWLWQISTKWLPIFSRMEKYTESIGNYSFHLDSPGQSISWKEQIFLAFCTSSVCQTIAWTITSCQGGKDIVHYMSKAHNLGLILMAFLSLLCVSVLPQVCVGRVRSSVPVLWFWTACVMSATSTSKPWVSPLSCGFPC